MSTIIGCGLVSPPLDPRHSLCLALAVLIPAFVCGPLLGALGVFYLQHKDAPTNQQKPAPGAEEAIPQPKGSDILRGFIELRKGIFKENRDKVILSKCIYFCCCYWDSYIL